MAQGENGFIEDGHVLHFRLKMDQVIIERVTCPFRVAKGGYCSRMRDYCVVQRFIGVYGTELCIGEVSLDDGPIEIAWHPVLGDSDLDSELGSIWYTPIADEDYLDSKNVDS